MEWRAVVLALVIFLPSIACKEKPAEATVFTSNKSIQVDRLFSHDGVTIYRFQDQGHTVYYAVPYKGPLELTNLYETCVNTSDGNRNVHTSCTNHSELSVTIR